jgi:hypothetical protein
MMRKFLDFSILIKETGLVVPNSLIDFFKFSEGGVSEKSVSESVSIDWWLMLQTLRWLKLIFIDEF